MERPRINIEYRMTKFNFNRIRCLTKIGHRFHPYTNQLCLHPRDPSFLFTKQQRSLPSSSAISLFPSLVGHLPSPSLSLITSYWFNKFGTSSLYSFTLATVVGNSWTILNKLNILFYMLLNQFGLRL